MSKVIVQPIGGLGNQMFCYAAGLGLARRLQCEVAIDLMHYEFPGTRPYCLGHLNVPQNITPLPMWNKIPNPVIKKVIHRIRRQFIFREAHFHYDERIENLTPPVTISGYFQSWRYFVNVEDELITIFRPAKPLGTTAREWAEKIRVTKNSVAVHIRRGDYLTASARRVHGILDISYYLEAVKTMSSSVPQPRYFFFSDDHEWVRQNILPHIPGELVQTEGTRPWEDMHLMSLCRHNIIANSSFSWWGAYLNRNGNKIVIAPKQWFSAVEMQKKNCRDLLPPDWMSI